MRWLTTLALLLVAGCGTPTPVPEFPTAPAVSTPAPTRITIPTIGATSDLIPLGLQTSGAMEVPSVDDPGQAGWYEPGPEPGERGPAVIVGHVDGRIDGRPGQPGVFHRLHTLKVGDPVLIDRLDGTTARFVVERVATFPKTEFPTMQVYGNRPSPELRLITCGDTFDPDTRSYRGNVIAFAVHTP